MLLRKKTRYEFPQRAYLATIALKKRYHMGTTPLLARLRMTIRTFFCFLLMQFMARNLKLTRSGVKVKTGP
jgi:hypothetical protein